jgi:hypothetical protein
MASIVWQIEWMKTTPTSANPPECVVTVGWLVNGTQVQDGKTWYATAYGTCGFSAPGDPFTPYANLTQDQVLGWVWASGVDKALVEANIQRQFDEQINPPVVDQALPWA